MRVYRLQYFFLLLLFAFCIEIAAQKQNNVWYFGENAGLDFKTSPPTPLKGELLTNEGCASIADHAGALLFYTDGLKVWDRRHQTMPNGTGLLGGNSSTQSAVIVPLPNSCTQYYIFTTEDHSSDGGLAYSIIDMELNDGFGDIIPGSKNIIVLNSTPEKITSVLHVNGVDIWLITHLFNTYDFYAYLLTENGLSTTPVISSVGAFIPNNDLNWIVGPVKSSHDGSKIVSVSSYFQVCEMFDFNSATGVLSNPFNIYSLFSDEQIYGVEFSPNDSLLYLTGYSPVQEELGVFQINILDTSPQAVILSNTQENFGCCALQLGPDQKIYLSHWGQSSLDVIHQPDKRGTDCLFEAAGVPLLPDTRARHGLPQNVPYSFCPHPSLGNDQLRCIGDTVVLGISVEFSKECPVTLSWFDGTTEPSKTITSSGLYWCDMMTTCSSYRDSIQIQFDSVLHANVAVSICTGDIYEGYDTPGIYTDTFPSTSGCDSIRVLNLTIRPAYVSSVEKWICDGYAFEGYGTSGIYIDTFLAKSGCDSIRVLHLIVAACGPIIYYPLDACVSVMNQGSHMDYSEFTPDFPTSKTCADVDASFLYRAFPEKHSCTPGVNSSPAMCVTTLDTCEYVAGSPASVIIEFTIDPLPDSIIRLTRLEFYEKGPHQYNWINGSAGLNNRPLLFGIRILKNGELVFLEMDIPTHINWGSHLFDLSINENFLLDSIANFRIELLSYCRIGANSDISVWDLDEITISGGCVPLMHDQPIIDGFVLNRNNQGMRNISVELSSDPLFTEKQITRTNGDGYYFFNDVEFGNSYYVRGYKNDDPLNGVSIIDLISIQKHLLGISAFTSLEQFVAADANRSNFINVLDLVTLQKLLLGKYTEFPGNTSWRFGLLPQDFSIMDLSLFKEIKFIESLQGSVHGVNFLGIKTGDLNGDARR